MRICMALAAAAAALLAQERRDPAAWGSDHAGQPVPEYIPGDECLFCHRNDIGNAWQKNSHRTTLLQREDAPGLGAALEGEPKLAAFAKEVTHFLGYRRHVRPLKKDGYGKFDLLSARLELGAERKPFLAHPDGVRWEGTAKFAARCAGCHTTAVDPATGAFGAIGIDCYACHGVVDLEHSNDTSKIFLSKKRRGDARAITATCASCHLRDFGKSRSTGRPYPNNFVPGDNLFRDYEVDWSKAEDESLNPGDRHVYRNVRDVMLRGEETTCLACHRVHANDTLKHRRVLTNDGCQDCHHATGPKNAVKAYTVRSALCEY